LQRAQQPAMPVIGFLGISSEPPASPFLAGFRRGLTEAGYVEGRNVAIEFRWADGRYERVPELAADLVGRRVTVIVTVGGELSALAAKAATATIPIVFNIGHDPVRSGLVASLGQPGGNATGVNIFTTELAAKRLGLLHDTLPTADLIAVLINPNFPAAAANAREVERAARAVGKDVTVLNASSDERDRGELRDDGAIARRRAARCRRPVLQQPARSHCGDGRAAGDSCGL
jgi:putative ABC transport system substrate-binding protein